MKDYNSLLKNTNLRYHFAKEFERHRTICDKKKKKEIYKFIIPLFSTITTLSITLVAAFKDIIFKGEPYNGHPSLLQIIIAVLGPPIIFLIICVLSYLLVGIGKFIAKLFTKFFRSQYKSSNTASTEASIVIANKFDYEIFNLVFLAYSLQKESEEDLNIRDYNVLESVFYLKLAIKKIHKFNSQFHNLLGHKISKTRFNYCLSLCRITINMLNACDRKDMIQVDILGIRDQYNGLAGTLKNNYNMNIEALDF